MIDAPRRLRALRTPRAARPHPANPADARLAARATVAPFPRAPHAAARTSLWPWPRWLSALVSLTLSAGVSVTVLAVVAFGLRLWHFRDIPRYADEINEIMPAFGIVRGDSFPLTSGPKHIGAAFDYLLAAVFLVFGRSPDLPRLVLVVSGVATVLLVYGYARSLRGHGAGLLAAGLLAVSAPHVLLSSRVAWSVSMTPLLVVGAAWALDRAVLARRPRWLLAAGLLAGVALQAHPSVISLLPGLGLFVLLRGRFLLRRPEAYLGIALCVLGCANVLIYNWHSGAGGMRSVTQEYPDDLIGIAVYAANAMAPWHGFVRTLASAVDPSQPPSILAPLAMLPFVLLVALVSGVGLLYTARRVTLLPLATVLGALLVLPLVHDDFEPLLKARYLMPLVPLTFVAVGVLGVDVARKARAGGWPPGRVWMPGAWMTGGVWAVMAAGMLLSLIRFESMMLAADCTNAPQRAFVAALKAQQQPGEWILLDEGSVRSAERVGYLTLLELSRARVGEARLIRGGIRTELKERPSFLTAVDDSKAEMVFARQGIPLTAAHPEIAGSDAQSGSGIGLYRVTGTGATLLYHDAAPGCGSLLTN